MAGEAMKHHAAILGLRNAERAPGFAVAIGTIRPPAIAVLPDAVKAGKDKGDGHRITPSSRRIRTAISRNASGRVSGRRSLMPPPRGTRRCGRCTTDRLLTLPRR